MRKFAIALVVLVLAAGCHKQETDTTNTDTITTDTATAAPASETSTASTTATTSTSSTAPIAATGSPTQGAGAATTPVRVELQEYEIRMPETLPAGKSSLLVVNSGKVNHGLIIEGNGVRFGTTEALTRGGSQTLEVDLKPGTYQVYCPVDGHKAKGMSRTLNVQ